MDIILDDRQIDLIEEGIDVSLRMGDLPDSSLAARRIGRARRLVIGTPAYFARAGEPRVPGELAAHECVIYAKGPGRDVWLFRNQTSEISVTVKGRLRISAAEGVRSALLAGMGLSVVSEWMFSRELASGEVKAVLMEWVVSPIDVFPGRPRGKRQGPVFRHLRGGATRSSLWFR
jgi:DNA-binding transcriptional LysR family regulator